MSVLEAIRIVKVLPGVGIFLEENPNKDLIARMDEMVRAGKDNLIQLLEIRQAIESQAAYLAAMRRTEADLKLLTEAFERLRHSVDRNEVAAEEDFRFHMAVVDAACNPMLMEAVKFFSEKFLAGLHQSRSESIRIPGKSKAVLDEHWRIYRAIADQNPDLAHKAMSEHLQNVISRYY